MAAAVVTLHVVGFSLLIAASHGHYAVGGRTTFGIGTGTLAYTLGLRHAFDADHICAIDGTTRKLMADGQRPLGVGFFFSLGHSTVVFVLALLFSLGVKAVAGQGEGGGAALHRVAGGGGTRGVRAVLSLIPPRHTPGP